MVPCPAQASSSRHCAERAGATRRGALRNQHHRAYATDPAILDNNGLKDVGEPGINGVTVQLFRSDQTPGVSTPYRTITTSGDGLYSFTGLPAGSYRVHILDANQDDIADGPFIATTTATVGDVSGFYEFTGLAPNTYIVKVRTSTLPAGVVQTSDRDLDGVPVNNTAILTTTAANNPAVSSVNSSSGTTVIQTVTITGSFVNAVDFAFISEVDFDFGDLPLIDAMTTLGQDGARHTIPDGGSTRWLGSTPSDAESNGIYNAQAAPREDARPAAQWLRFPTSCCIAQVRSFSSG